MTSLLSPNANGSSLYCRIPGMVPFPYGGGVGNRYNADIISLSEYGVGEGMYFWVQRGDQTSDFELLMSRNNCHT